MKINKVAFHRNGSSGEPFHIIKFTNKKEKMIGIVFKEKYHVAVFNQKLLGKGIIDFGVNSFRGDNYENKLRNAIK